MNSKIMNHLGLELAIAWSSCPVMLKDTPYSGQKVLEQKTRRLFYLCISKSHLDFLIWPTFSLSQTFFVPNLCLVARMYPLSALGLCSFNHSHTWLKERHPFFSSFPKPHNPTKKLSSQLHHQGQQKHFTHHKPVLAACFLSLGLLGRFLSLPEKEIWSPNFTALTKTLWI